jgi:ATP-binding cassette subfamily B protein
MIVATPPASPNGSPFIEPLPPVIAAQLAAQLNGQLSAQVNSTGADQTVHMQVGSDMDTDGGFTQSWIVISDQYLFIFKEDAPTEPTKIPIETLQEIKIEALIGGGLLEIIPKQGRPTYVRYSSSLAPKFAEVAEGLNQLIRREALELPTEVEKSRCSNCHRLLPEKDGICPACISKWDTLKRVCGYLAPYKAKAMILVLITIAATLVDLVPPLIVQRIIDDALPHANNGLLIGLVLALFGAGLLSWGGEVSHGWVAVWLAMRMVATIRQQLYQRLQHMPLRFFDKRKVGSLMSRITNDADRLEGFLIDGIPFLFTNALMVVGILGLLLYMSWRLTIFVLLPVPLLVFGGMLIWNRLMRGWSRQMAKWSRFNSHLSESISGIRVVKAFAQEKREARRFDQRNEELRQANVIADRNIFTFFNLMNFFMSFGVFFVWYFGGRQILNEELKLGQLMAFISYVWMLYRPLKWFGEFTNWLTRAFAGAERIFEIIDSKAESFEDPNAVPMPQMNGEVIFKDAYFGYDRGKPVLKGVDLEIKAGEMIGLVGKSGVGKSTLINLICRFYDLDRGVLSIDGVDIRKIRLEDLRRQIGLVHQQSFLFNGSIAENISYGKPDAPFKDIMRAARAANAHEFIITKLDGYDTLVGEEGNKLSGGEKQRLAIARAILHDPKILILDEATSSLDTPTEKKIQEAIGRLVQGRTTFAIAHRLSTLRSADRLVVVDGGKIAEVGTHTELMEREGLFYNLVTTQQQTSAIMATSG